MQASKRVTDLQLVHDWAAGNNTLDTALFAATLDTFLRLTAGQAESAQRQAVWWAMKVVRQYSVAQVTCPGSLHVALLQRLIHIRFRAAAAIQFEHIRAHAEYPALVTSSMLVALVELCGLRSARPATHNTPITQERRLHKIGLGEDVRQFLMTVWHELERLHGNAHRRTAAQASLAGLDLPTTSPFPSPEAHMALLRTCSQQGDMAAMQHAHKLIHERFPQLEFSAATSALLVQGASRAGDAPSALFYLQRTGTPTVPLLRALLHSIRSVSAYHHFNTHIAHVAKHADDRLDLGADIDTACRTIAQSDILSGHDVALVPIPATSPVRHPGTGSSSALVNARQRVMVGVRKSVSAHYFIVTHAADHVALASGERFSEIHDVIQAFEHAPAGPSTCVRFGCLSHGSKAAESV